MTESSSLGTAGEVDEEPPVNSEPTGPRVEITVSPEITAPALAAVNTEDPDFLFLLRRLFP
ncbi:MAG: hypothetical protein FWC19_07505 [Treponema sp.]|nr:hypothetical protein [Treponema sp.]MCL2272626.1 hypothetical protein [Treponema sp.]